jgi:hypothetical protein
VLECLCLESILFGIDTCGVEAAAAFPGRKAAVSFRLPAVMTADVPRALMERRGASRMQVRIAWHVISLWSRDSGAGVNVISVIFLGTKNRAVFLTPLWLSVVWWPRRRLF